MGSQGGVEALAVFHRLIFDEWLAGSLETPLARIGVDEAHRDDDAQRLQFEDRRRMHRLHNFQTGGPEKPTRADDPRHVLPESGRLADFWYLHDGDMLCHSALVISCLTVFDTAKTEIGAESNRRKKEVTYHIPDLDNTDQEWRMAEIRTLASHKRRCSVTPLWD